MRQLMLYIVFMMAMVFGNHGELSAATRLTSHCSKDKLEKVEHKQDSHEAQINDAFVLAYGACGHRPERLSPSGNIYANPSANRLSRNKIRILSNLLSSMPCDGEPTREESAPIHFDVASMYYVICLRHLLC